MTPMIAEILVTNWQTAITILGVAAMICGVLVMFIRFTIGASRAGNDVRSEPLTDPTVYKNETVTTLTEIDHDAISAVLKEMGYNVEVERAATAESITKVNAAMARDYSALMKRIDEIKTAQAASAAAPVSAEHPYVDSTDTPRRAAACDWPHGGVDPLT